MNLTKRVVQVRHGESMDNLVSCLDADATFISFVILKCLWQRSVWAGWKDAPLSNHGGCMPYDFEMLYRLNHVGMAVGYRTCLFPGL